MRATTSFRRRLIDVYLSGWLLGAAVSALGLVFRPDDIASGTAWGASKWQREIGIWNVAVGLLILQALRTGHRPTKLMLARVGVVVSLLLGANHVMALTSNGTAPTRTHATAVAANALNLLGATISLTAERGGVRTPAAL